MARMKEGSKTEEARDKREDKGKRGAKEGSKAEEKRDRREDKRPVAKKK